MPKMNPNAARFIDNYITDAASFNQEICKKLRKLIFQAEPGIIEDWKWGPNYQHPQGVMVCGYSAFTKHVTFTFFQGAQMRDPKKLFNYGDANAHNRSIKFLSAEDINEKIILAYIKEAVELNKKGQASPINNAKDKKIEIPKDFKKLLKQKDLLKKFEGLAFTHRKEYVLWIESAKKEETRIRRLEKAIEMVKKGLEKTL